MLNRISCLVAGGLTLLSSLAATTAHAEKLFLNESGWEIWQGDTIVEGCTIEKEFNDGTYVLMGFDSQTSESYIQMFNDDFEDVEDGVNYPVRIDIDGARYKGEAYGFNDGEYVGFEIAQNDLGFLLDLANKNTLTLTDSSGDSYSLSLAGTRNALGGMMACFEDFVSQ